MEALEEVKRQQKALSSRRQNTLSMLMREPELTEPDQVIFWAHALVVPSTDPWARVCYIGQDYGLCAVYDPATPYPSLVRVQDPFGNHLTRVKESALIRPSQIVAASEEPS